MFNVLFLGAFVATAEQQDERLAFLPVVDPEAWANIDPKLENAIAYLLPIAQQTRLQAI
jgi:hypothetical protein